MTDSFAIIAPMGIPEPRPLAVSSIGFDPKVVGSPHFAGSTDAGLNLVEDQADAVCVTDLSKFLDETLRRDDVAAFPKHWFQDDRRDVLRRTVPTEEVVNAFDDELADRLPARLQRKGSG